MKDLGMRSYRVNISHAHFAPELKALVTEAKAFGIDILPVLTPDVDMEGDDSQSLYSKSYALAFTLASGLSEQVRVWELGNELENFAIIKACEIQDDGVQYNCSWGPAGGNGPLHYFTPRWVKVSSVLKGMIDGINAVDPTLRKAIGTAGWGHTGAFTRMLQDGIDWDITVWHHYEGNPEEALKVLANYGRPIWVTEFNNSQGSENGEQQQAQGLTRMMQHLRDQSQLYRVEAAHIYELLDEPYWAPSFEAVMGLVRVIKDGKGGWRLGPPKPAYQAVKQFIASAPKDPPARTAGTTPSKQIQPDIPRYAKGTTRCDVNQIDRSVTSFENQVAYSYCLLAGRLPSPAEQWHYVLALKAGSGVIDVLQKLLNSNELRTTVFPQNMSNGQFVIRLYQLLLDRNPDGQGFADYVAQLGRGSLTRQQLATTLLISPEFQNRQSMLFPPRQPQ